MFTDDISVKLPEKGSLFFSDSSFDWLNGVSFDFEFTDKLGLSYEYNRSESTVTVGVNFDIEKELENGNIKKKDPTKRMIQAIIRTMRALKDTQHSPK